MGWFIFVSTIRIRPIKEYAEREVQEYKKMWILTLLSGKRLWSRNLEDPKALALRDELKKGESIVLEISPKYFSTWDYSKQ